MQLIINKMKGIELIGEFKFDEGTDNEYMTYEHLPVAVKKTVPGFFTSLDCIANIFYFAYGYTIVCHHGVYDDTYPMVLYIKVPSVIQELKNYQDSLMQWARYLDERFKLYCEIIKLSGESYFEVRGIRKHKFAELIEKTKELSKQEYCNIEKLKDMQELNDTVSHFKFKLDDVEKSMRQLAQ